MSSFRTLSELVSTALTDATHQIKVASAASVPRFGGTDVDFLKLAGEDTAHEEPKSKKDEKDEKKSKKEEDGEKRAAVSYAMKVAEALELAAPIVQKLAEADRSPIDAPGPAVMAGSQMGAASFPKSPKAATDPGKEGVGAVGTLATNAKDLKSADWTKNKEASEAFVATKIAQAKLLRDLGQVEAADAILSKIAQDPSSPQPNLPPNSGGGIRPAVMPNVPSGPVPDSAQGVAAMTKGQAKDPSVKSVSEFIQQTPGKDPAVAATQLTAAGQKVSSILLREKQAKRIVREVEVDDPREGRAGTIGGALGILGGGIGGGIEGSRYGHTGEGIARGALGSLAGSIGGAALGAVTGSQALANVGALGGGAAGAHYAMQGARKRWARETGHDKGKR